MKETKFKNTEIGMIPDDWEVKKLGAVFDIGNGRDYKHLDTGKIPVYGTGGLMTYVNEYLYDGETVCIGRKGTINMPQYHNGKIWTVDTLFYTYNFRKTDVKFLYYLTQRIDWNSYNTATGVPSLTSQNISNILVSFPPLHEQHRIASALTSMDNLISSLGKLIEKKKNIKQGAMQQLLTGKTRLKGFSEPWVEKKLGDVAVNYTGLTYSPMNVKSYGTLVLRSSNIQKGILVFNDNVFVDMDIPSRAIAKKNDLLICVRNGSKALIGKSAVITDYADGMAFGAFMTILHANDIQQGFLNYLWQTDYIQQQVKDNMGATINQITNADIEQFKIVVPHSLKEQQAIATILTKMDDEITALEAKKAKYEAIKQGMMQQLLTGKIRLIS